MNLRILFSIFLATLFVGLERPRAAEPIVIEGQADTTKLIPMTMTGFSGEAASVLKFDLEIAGFDFDRPEKALFALTGSNAGQVEGHLVDHSKNRLVDRAYSGPTVRLQAHALANDVILAITQKRGITQTKIAFKVEAGAQGAGEIYVADYDGHNAVAVTQDHVIVKSPAWVPGQRKLFYVS